MIESTPGKPGQNRDDALGHAAAQMSEVTQLLNAIDAGDGNAAAQLLPLIYEELRKLAAAKMAQEKPGQTLQATALVHEAWLRLAGPNGHKVWNSRGHFFGAAAEAMRRILVEAARRKARLRHGGQLERVAVDEVEITAALPEDRLVQMSEALDELEREAPEAAQVVKLRYFAGLTQEQVSEMMGISLRTAERHWAWAKAWLFRWIRTQEKG
jgi:RNA polymerase sigma factor (TIGR02999 family)